MLDALDLALETLVLDSVLSMDTDSGDEKRELPSPGDEEYFEGIASGWFAPRPKSTCSEAADLLISYGRPD
jgi:hypothetical protein